MIKKTDVFFTKVIHGTVLWVAMSLAAIWAAEQEFAEAVTMYPSTVFAKPSENINNSLQGHPETAMIGKDWLTAEEAWQGIKWKAERPEQFVRAIRQSEIMEGTRHKTTYGETFVRLSKQLWFVDKETNVKEEVHIFEDLKKVLFLGRPIAGENAMPLFHVEHGLKTEGDNLFNTWKIVFLTSKENLPFKSTQFQGTSVGIYLETLKQLSP